MASKHLQAVLQYIHKVAQPSASGEATDGELVRRFLSERDGQAFATIVRRHGPLVFTVCQRILTNIQDTEDAFQATFLILVRKAPSIAKQISLASWLHGVARRVSVRVKTKARQREKCDRQWIPRPAPDSLQEMIWRDLRVLLDEEVERLPGRYREAFVLCYMQGKTNDEAATILGCPKGTIDSRLSRARERLRQRLVRRGLAVSAGLVATMLSQNAVSASVPMALELLTIQSAVSTLAGQWIAGSLISKQVHSLTQEIVKAMFLTKLKVATVVALIVGLTATGTGIMRLQSQEAEKKEASEPGARHIVIESEKSEAAPVKQKWGDDLAQLQLEMTVKEYLQVVSDLRKAEVELTIAKANNLKVQPVSSVRLQEMVEGDARITNQNRLVRKLEDQLNEARNHAAAEDAKTKQYSDDLKEAKVVLERTRQDVTKAMIEHFAHMTRLDRDKETAKITERVEFLAAMKKVLQSDMEELEKKMEAISGSPKNPKIDQLENQVRELKAQVEELKKRK